MEEDELKTRLNNLEERIRSDDEELFNEVESFYSDLKQYLEEILKYFESDYEETCEIPEMCVLAHEDYFDFSEPDLLISASLMIAGRRNLRQCIPDDKNPDLWRDLSSSFMLGQVSPEGYDESDIHRVTEIKQSLEGSDLHEPLGKYFHDRDAMAMNTLVGFDHKIPLEKVPLILRPLFWYMSNRSHREAKETLVHEMTHAYIHKKSKPEDFTDEMRAVDEAATQTLNDLFGREGVPPEKYYRGEHPLDPEIMQAARQAFFNSTEDMDINEAVSELRTRAVTAINKIDKGEDPIAAVREQDDHKTKMIRVASHATKKTVDELEEDLMSLGLENLMSGNYVPSSNLRSTYNLKRDSDFGIMLLQAEIKDELVEPTEKLVSLAKKPVEILEQDYWPNKWSEKQEDVLKDIFGKPSYTDPEFIPSNGQFSENLVFILETYLEVVEIAKDRARKLEAVSEELQNESEQLYPRYENPDFEKDVKKIHEHSEQLEKETKNVGKNLGNIEEMIETAIKKINRIEAKKQNS